MGLWLLLLFTVVPLIEFNLLLWVGGMVGFWPTVALVVATGAIGAALAKREGFRVMRAWQTALAEGRKPADGVVSGLLVLVGGVLLVTPGVLTDLFGLMLLIPWTRRGLAALILQRLERGIERGSVRVVTMQGGPFEQGPFAHDPFTDGPFGRPMGGPFGPFGASPFERSNPNVIDVEGEEIEVEPGKLPSE